MLTEKQQEGPPPNNDQISAQALDASIEVYTTVVKWLRHRFLTVYVIIGVLSPIIGILGGALLESRIFSDSRDKLLFDAKKEIESKVKEAYLASEAAKKEIGEAARQAQNNLSQISSTKAALDLVLKGTITGEFTQVELKRKELNDKLVTFQSELQRCEDLINTNFPDGLSKFSVSTKELLSLKDSAEDLKKLFNNNMEAQALAGAFYRIDEFIGTFEMSLAVPSNIQFSTLSGIASTASSLTTRVKFYNKKNHTEPALFLEWPSLTAEITPGELVDPVGKANKFLRFRCKLEDIRDWWSISSPGQSTLKTLDLRTIQNFDTVEVELAFPWSAKDAQENLKSCEYPLSEVPGKTGTAPCPEFVRLDVNVNRVHLDLQQSNVNVPEGSLYFGSTISVDAPVAATKDGDKDVPEKLGRTVYVFSNTSLFNGSAKKYVEEIGDRK